MVSYVAQYKFFFFLLFDFRLWFLSLNKICEEIMWFQIPYLIFEHLGFCQQNQLAQRKSSLFQIFILRTSQDDFKQGKASTLPFWIYYFKKNKIYIITFHSQQWAQAFFLQFSWSNREIHCQDFSFIDSLIFRALISPIQVILCFHRLTFCNWEWLLRGQLYYFLMYLLLYLIN